MELMVASFVVLFQELTIIRWLPGQVRVLAYFPNLILLSAFLGSPRVSFAPAAALSCGPGP
jgi:uncharacterized membrane protein